MAKKTGKKAAKPRSLGRKNSEIFNFRVNRDLKERFDGKCDEMDLDRQGALRTLMHEFVTGQKEVPVVDFYDARFDNETQRIKIVGINENSGSEDILTSVDAGSLDELIEDYAKITHKLSVIRNRLRSATIQLNNDQEMKNY